MAFHLAKHFTLTCGGKTAESNFIGSGSDNNISRGKLPVNGVYLKCYYDQKITFIFSSDFETMFIKHSASEIISLNFEKKTVNLNCNFPF